MTVQEAIKGGWTQAQHLVHVWHHVRYMDVPLERRRAWVKEWGGLTGVIVPAWMVLDEALSLPREGV